MKQVKSIFLTALAALAFAACNKDEITEPGSPGEVISGKETYVSFNFQVGGNQTNSRAGMTAQAADENTVAAGRILIFDKASGALLTNATFIPAEFGEKKSVTVKTTSGIRRIYIIAGTDGTSQIDGKLAALSTTTPSTLNDFYALMTDGEYTSGPDEDMGTGFKDLVRTGKLVMSNVADLKAEYTLLPGISEQQSTSGTPGVADAAVNRFDFNLQRAVAKGSLLVHLKNQAATLQTEDGIFTLSADVTYGVRNVNRSTLYVQQFLNDQLQADKHDHDSEGGLLPHAAFYNAFDNSTSMQLKDPATYKPYYFGGYPLTGNDAQKTQAQLSGASSLPNRTPVYFSENSNNKQLRGNTTYFGIATKVASIKGDDIASDIVPTGIGHYASQTTISDYTPGDFWYARHIPTKTQALLEGKLRRVFTSQDIAFKAMYLIATTGDVKFETYGFQPTQPYTADDLMKAYNGTHPSMAQLSQADKDLIDYYVPKYTGGVSYYRLNLYEETSETKTRRHLVRRNHDYQATVKSFATIGDPTEGDLDKDPEKPVDADVTYVTAVITVTAWHTIDMGDDL